MNFPAAGQKVWVTCEGIVDPSIPDRVPALYRAALVVQPGNQYRNGSFVKVIEAPGYEHDECFHPSEIFESPEAARAKGLWIANNLLLAERERHAIRVAMFEKLLDSQ